MVRPIALILLALLGLPHPAGAQPAAADPGTAPVVGPLFPPMTSPLPDPVVPEGLVDITARSCAVCHAEVHSQWAGEGHSQGFSNPLFQWAWLAAGKANSCLDCHAPFRSQRHDVPRSSVGPDHDRTEPNSAYRPLFRNEGVGCAACHVRDGVVLGPRPVQPGSSPHPVRESPELRDPGAACAPCHQRTMPGHEDKALYDTWAEWADSAYADAGIRCQDCHMPLRAGEMAGGRFDAYPSHSTTRDLSAALALDLRLDRPWYDRGTKGVARLTVWNAGAGHALPTGDPFHRIQVRMHIGGLEGVKEQSAELWLGRNIGRTPPYRERSDTRLLPGQSVLLDLSIHSRTKMDAGDATLTIEVWYHPIAPDALPDEEIEGAAARRVTLETVPIEIR